MAQPPNSTVPSNGGLEKQTAPTQGKQDFHGTFQSNEQQDSFGEPPLDQGARGLGLERALQGKPFAKCPSCGCAVAPAMGMDNHSCAPMFDYYANTKANIADAGPRKRN